MNNIDQSELNRTIDSALEALWVKLIEDNQYATGMDLYTELYAHHYALGDLFWAVFAEDRDFDMDAPVGDWK